MFVNFLANQDPKIPFFIVGLESKARFQHQVTSRIFKIVLKRTQSCKVFNLPRCRISSFQIFLKIMLVTSFKIGFLFLVPADLALICWLKVETFLNHLTYDKPSSRVVPAYPQLFCNSERTNITAKV